jgi:hypothetical protein
MLNENLNIKKYYFNFFIFILHTNTKQNVKMYKPIKYSHMKEKITSHLLINNKIFIFSTLI